jgi:DNA recombination protein RmuC
MPILRTVANLWMIARSNTEAREISHRAGDLYNQVCRMARRLQRLGQSLNTANGHYNDAVRSLVGKQGLQGKVERFRQISPAANRSLPTVRAVTSEADHHALDTVPGTLESVAETGRGSAPDTPRAAPENDIDTAPPRT